MALYIPPAIHVADSLMDQVANQVLYAPFWAWVLSLNPEDAAVGLDTLNVGIFLLVR